MVAGGVGWYPAMAVTGYVLEGTRYAILLVLRKSILQLWKGKKETGDSVG
jgi:hypothetical protein